MENNENKINWIKVLKVVAKILTAIVSGVAGGTLIN